MVGAAGLEALQEEAFAGCRRVHGTRPQQVLPRAGQALGAAPLRAFTRPVLDVVGGIGPEVGVYLRLDDRPVAADRGGELAADRRRQRRGRAELGVGGGAVGAQAGAGRYDQEIPSANHVEGIAGQAAAVARGEAGKQEPFFRPLEFLYLDAEETAAVGGELEYYVSHLASPGLYSRGGVEVALGVDREREGPDEHFFATFWPFLQVQVGEMAPGRSVVAVDEGLFKTTLIEREVDLAACLVHRDRVDAAARFAFGGGDLALVGAVGFEFLDPPSVADVEGLVGAGGEVGALIGGVELAVGAPRHADAADVAAFHLRPGAEVRFARLVDFAAEHQEELAVGVELLHAGVVFARAFSDVYVAGRVDRDATRPFELPSPRALETGLTTTCGRAHLRFGTAVQHPPAPGLDEDSPGIELVDACVADVADEDVAGERARGDA